MNDVEAVLVNCTPHTITLLGEDGKTLALPGAPVGTEARVTDIRMPLATVVDRSLHQGSEFRLRVNRKVFDRKGARYIPARRPGTAYIVSAITAQAFPERDDFLVPDEIIRDDKGEVTGCRALAQLWPPTNQFAREQMELAREQVGHVNVIETRRGG